MKPHEFEALVRTKALVVKQAPEPVVESSPAPVLEAMDIDSLDHQYQTMLDEGWFDNQTSDAENDAKVAGRRNFLKVVGTGLAGAGLAAAGLGASQNAQAGNAPEIKMQDARHGTVAYQGKNIPITLNDTTRAMGTLAKAKLNGQTVDIRIGLDGARAWIPPSAMPHMGESMMAGGTEAYTMEDEQLDGMALGELQAIAQAAKKIFASVKQGVPLEAWMYKKITNGNEGLTAVAQQINNPAVREQPGVAEGAPIVVMPSHKRLEKKHKPSLSRGMDPAKAQGEQDARDGKPYNNPYPFKKELGAPGNWEHNSYKASYDSVKQGVAEGSDEGKTGKNFAKIAPTLKPLTDEQILEIDDGLATWMFPVDTRVTDRELAFARAIEAAHGIKEQDMTPQIRMKGNVPGDKIKEQGVAEGSDQPVGYIDDEGKLVTIGHKPGFAKSVGHANGGWIDTGRAIPDSWKAVYTKNLEQGVAEGAGTGEYSRILQAFKIYINTMGDGIEFYNWANRPEALKVLAQKAGTTPEKVKQALESLNWGQKPDNRWDEEDGPDQQGVAEGSLDDILAMAKKVSPNARTRGSRDEEIARRDAMLAQRAQDHANAPEPKGVSDDERASLEAELQQLMPKYDRHYQMIDNYTQHMQAKHIADRVHEIQRKLKPGVAEGWDPEDDEQWSAEDPKDEMFGAGDAYKRGIQDYRKFMQTKVKPSNPYSYTKQARQADNWEKGFEDGRYKQGMSEIKDPNDSRWSQKYNKDLPESTDYASAVNNLLNEFAGGMGVSSVAVGPGAMKNPARVGSLFGGSYNPKSPFKKKTKKESIIKR